MKKKMKPEGGGQRTEDRRRKSASHATGRAAGRSPKSKLRASVVNLKPAPPVRRGAGRKSQIPRAPLTGEQNGLVSHGADYGITSREEVFGGSSSGIQTVTTYEGIKQALFDDLRPDLLLKDIRYRYDSATPGKLTIYSEDTITGDPTSQNSKVTEVWDLDWAEVNNRLSYAPLFRGTDTSGGITKIDQGVLLVEDYIAKFNVNTSKDWQTLDFTTYFKDAAGATITSTLANIYRDKRAHGEEDWQTFRPILIQRIVEATTGQVQASNVGINKVWKINAQGPLNKIDAAIGGFVYRKLPARKTLFKGKIQIEQRYEGATLWDTDLYPAAGA